MSPADSLALVFPQMLPVGAFGSGEGAPQFGHGASSAMRDTLQ
ncbi:MAG TPA: hypothetical protein VN207_01610 [Ktedonobacteraceae bacterium]|nr:hypothetical protein [Ktedonobacteraceae bacterium]